MKEYRILLISSYLIGIGLGILLGLLNVFMISESLTTSKWLITILEIVITISLPFCVYIVKKFGYSFLIISMVMVVVSFIICLIYAAILRNSALEYQATTTIFKDIMVKASVIHILFLITSLIIHYFDMKKLKDIEDE